MGILWIACLEEDESAEKLGRMKGELIYTFPLVQANPTLISRSQQRLHKSTISAETLLGQG